MRGLLLDFRSMVRRLVGVTLEREVRSAIPLRKETADGFRASWRSRYAAPYHHSACSVAVGIARSYWQLKRRDPRTQRPDVARLRATLDGSLYRIRGEELVVTVRPGVYLRFPLSAAMRHQKWPEWSKHKLGEVTLTDRTVVLPF